MSPVFGSTYSSAYDVLYQDKDYEAECDMLESVFDEYGTGRVRQVLDLGCGTGNHAIPLARRGYEVVGVDRSAEMLDRARVKSPDVPESLLTFVQGDVTGVRLERQFDAAVMMFAVLGYQVANADVLHALETARAHLRPGGLFAFDVWYGPAVLSERPSQRLRVIDTEDGYMLRMASGELDTAQQVTTVHYELWRVQGDRVVERTQESHTMRFFFPQELALFLDVAGLELLRLGVFPDLGEEPNERTWNVMGVARVPPAA